MKKLIYICLVAASFLTVSCDMNDKNAGRFDDANPNSGWVQFADDVDSPIEVIYDGASTISLPVELHMPKNTNGTTINYTITDVVGSSAAIVPVRSGSFTIFKNSKGEVVRDGYLVINVVDAGLTEATEFDVTLTGSDNPNLKMGVEGTDKPTVVRVKVCPFIIGTTYDGASVTSEGDQGPDYTVTLVPVADTTNQFTVTSAWGPGLVPMLCNCAASRDYPATVTVNDDYTVTVVGIGNQVWYPGGSGTYDPCSDTFNINLRQGVFGTAFTVDVTWTGAN